MQNVNLKYLDFEKKVYHTLNKYYFTKYEKQYGVAVSGGPDSMLLLNVLSRWANLEGKFLNVFSIAFWVSRPTKLILFLYNWLFLWERLPCNISARLDLPEP